MTEKTKFPLCEKYGLEVFGAFPVVDAKDVEQALSRLEKLLEKERHTRGLLFIKTREQDKRIADLEKRLLAGKQRGDSLVEKIKSLEAENSKLKDDVKEWETLQALRTGVEKKKDVKE